MERVLLLPRTVQWVVVFVCFRWVQWGELENGSNDTICLAWLFCSDCRVSLFVPLFFPPAGPLPVSSSSSSCCFVRAAVVCCLLSTYVVLLAAFLIFLHHIIQNTCRLFFCLLSYYFSCFSGLACFVVFSYIPGTQAFHLPYLDWLRSFWFCFVPVCDHRICISLGWISTDTGCTDVE